jgi:magnesium chelatase subunit D
MHTRSTRARQGRESKIVRAASYPFSAIVGQEEIKLGLILNVIDPLIGGVLMMGHRGTGKSTAVRALADLLQDINVVRECSFNCDPTGNNLCLECDSRLNSSEKLKTRRTPVAVVDLPLGATEDRVCGSIDIRRALTEGVKAFEPGLLARANRGFLYIDEVNLLEDHLVDLLLDVAATGRNKVERENFSIEHPARFVLIGSGNPEEGELRPQLLDRFGLFIEVKTENDPEMRVEIISRREVFDRDPETFTASFAQEQTALQQKIARARRNFGNVQISKALLRKIATLCAELKIVGHRGELTIMRAARALAAFAGRRAVIEDDVGCVALMSLRHRLRRDPLSDTANESKIEKAIDEVLSNSASAGSGNNSEARPSSSERNKGQPKSSAMNGRNRSNSEKDEVPLDTAIKLSLPEAARRSDQMRPSPGRSRTRAGAAKVSSQSGRYIRATTRATAARSVAARIAIDATLRAVLAAGAGGTPELCDIANNLRFKRFARKSGTLFIFAIDTSGSMARARINKAKSAVLGLLKQSYINRDAVAIIAFRGASAELLLPPSRSIVRARRVLESLSVGGGTPLSAGLASALALAERASAERAGKLTLLLFTDGGANVPLHGNHSGDRLARQQEITTELSVLGAQLRLKRVETLVVETQASVASSDRAQTLAETLGAKHVRITPNQHYPQITQISQIL